VPHDQPAGERIFQLIYLFCFVLDCFRFFFLFFMFFLFCFSGSRYVDQVSGKSVLKQRNKIIFSSKKLFLRRNDLQFTSSRFRSFEHEE
jgi:hypothetical protein